MPRGVYPRTTNQLKAAVANLAKGRTPEVRAKVNKILKKNAENPEWRAKVGKVTKQAMWRPEVRERHLQGLEKALREHGANFKGGNGQEPTEFVERTGAVLVPLGFIPEYPVKTKGHKTGLNPPPCYKVDFGHPKRKIAIELDGPSHRPLAQKAKDEKKTAILESLGWMVLRIKH